MLWKPLSRHRCQVPDIQILSIYPGTSFAGRIWGVRVKVSSLFNIIEVDGTIWAKLHNFAVVADGHLVGQKTPNLNMTADLYRFCFSFGSSSRGLGTAANCKATDGSFIPPVKTDLSVTPVDFVQNRQFDLFVLDPRRHFISQTPHYPFPFWFIEPLPPM